MIDLIVYCQNYSLSLKLSLLSKFYCVLLKSFIMETIVASQSTWIVKTVSRVWEVIKIKVKTVANSLGWDCFGNYDGVFF